MMQLIELVTLGAWFVIVLLCLCDFSRRSRRPTWTIADTGSILKRSVDAFESGRERATRELRISELERENRRLSVVASDHEHARILLANRANCAEIKLSKVEAIKPRDLATSGSGSMYEVTGYNQALQDVRDAIASVGEF